MDGAIVFSCIGVRVGSFVAEMVDLWVVEMGGVGVRSRGIGIYGGSESWRDGV